VIFVLCIHLGSDYIPSLMLSGIEIRWGPLKDWKLDHKHEGFFWINLFWGWRERPPRNIASKV
jgi:hypothetical protein